MSITVAQIMELEIMPLHATLIAGHDGINKEVTYVTVMETPNLYELITGGEFVLSTLYTFQKTPELLLPAILKLIKQGISAIGIKPRPYFPEIPQEVIELANEYKIPMFEIHQEARYREIIKSVYAEINNYQTNLLIEVERYYQELTSTVLMDGEFSQLLKGLGRRKNCSVFLIRNDYKVLGSYHGLSKIQGIDVKERLEYYIGKNGEVTHYVFHKGVHIFPCQMRGQTIGYLILYDKSVLNEKFMLMAKQLVTFVTLKLIDQLDAEQKVLTALFDDILFKRILKEEELRERLALYGLKKKNMYRVIVIGGNNKNNQNVNVQTARRYCNKICDIIQNALVIEKTNEVVIIVANQLGDRLNGPTWVNALGEEALKEDYQVVIGIGPASDSAIDIHWSYNLAKNTMRIGLAAKKNGVLYYGEYLSELVLLGSVGTREQEYLVSRVIEPIKERDNSKMLMKTLDAVIFEDALESAALTLEVHINTLRYRMNRIREITGFDFFTAKGRYVLTTAYLMYGYKKG
ncbi:MAG: regulator of polyketide synthase expression [Firmicutes bacterium]|nr:regulator of polyketide synthase expression [Bacillota bacterium]